MSLPDVDPLLEQAAHESGLSDFGDLPFREGLDALHYGYTQESGLPEAVQSSLLGGLVRLLVKRLKLVEDRKQHPRMPDEKVEAPMIVLGLPRTGSTHLHALLATRPGARTPLQWEMSEPSPPPLAASFQDDPRISQVQKALDQRPNAAELMKVHPFGATRPEQCIGLIDWSFVNSAALATCRMPSYLQWFLNTDHRPAYEHHFRMLQHLQFGVPGEWVLKWPKHVFSLPALLWKYPDARIVWTHRDPGTVLASVANFVGTIRRSMDPGFDAVRFGAEWTALEEIGLLRAMAARDALSDDRQFLDIHYNDLVGDPVRTVCSIYDYFQLPVDDEVRERIAAYQDDNPQNKHGRHSYSPAEYGLNADELRERFSAYIRRYDVAPDLPRGGMT